MDKRIKTVEETCEVLTREISELQGFSQAQYRHIIEIQTKNTEAIKELSASTSSLVEAWATANKVASFMKWMGGIAIMASALYEIITGRPWN